VVIAHFDLLLTESAGSSIEQNGARRFDRLLPLVVNSRQDPFGCAPFESDFYRRFQADKLWTLIPAHAIAGQFIQSFKEYPPSQRVGSMQLDQVMEQLQSGAGK